MIRQLIVPAQNTYVLHLPDDLVGKNVELIAFATDDISSSELNPKTDSNRRTIENAIAFYKKNSVDFSKIEKWNR